MVTPWREFARARTLAMYVDVVLEVENSRAAKSEMARSFCSMESGLRCWRSRFNMAKPSDWRVRSSVTTERWWADTLSIIWEIRYWLGTSFPGSIMSQLHP
jgi:hypothetical protein